MSISATKISRIQAANIRFYLILTVASAVFGGVYELFSHYVYSYPMIYAFGYPLSALCFWVILAFRSPRAVLKKAAAQLMRGGVFTLMIGSIIRGVLEIFGTTNRLTVWFWVLGGGMLLAALIMQWLHKKKTITETEQI